MVITKTSKMRGKNDLLYIYREKKITPQNGCKSYTLYPSLMREEKNSTHSLLFKERNPIKPPLFP